MKTRILTNWTFSRALYLVLGIIIIIQSVMGQQWYAIAIGVYFAAMGLFAFGCAAGNCTTEIKQKTNNSIQDKDL